MEITIPPLPFIGLHIFTIASLLFLAAYSWHYRKIPGVRTWIITLGARIVWLTGAVMISESSSIAWRIVWLKITYIAGYALVPGWLLLVLQVSGKTNWITLRSIAMVLFLPVMVGLIILTNELHGWFTMRGPLPWLMIAYNYMLILLCYYINIQWIMSSSGLRRRQAIAMALAPAFSIFGQVINLFVPWPYASMALPVGFLLANLIWCWALLSLRIFNIMPIAQETVIHNMGDGFVVVDQQGYIYELNPAAAATLNISTSQAVGHQTNEIFSVWPELAAIAQSMDVEKIDAQFEHSGKLHYYELHSSPLLDHNNGFLGTVIIWHDTTAQHVAYEQLKVMEKSRRRLLSNISHDLRTPLSSVLGHSELLIEGIVESPEEQRDYLKRIHSKMLGFNRLIQDLFELAKIESQQGLFRMEQVLIAETMGNIYQKYLFDVQNAGMVFECNITVATNIMVAADVGRLDQVFANLISNAISYMLQGGGITISCEWFNEYDNTRSVVDRGKRILLKVADNGKGIAPEHIPKIFERFYRASNNRDASTDHSGLGLAIAKEIVVAHGGDIWVDETVSCGCTICFTLPTV